LNVKTLRERERERELGGWLLSRPPLPPPPRESARGEA
jgi:hypothetical protein